MWAEHKHPASAEVGNAMRIPLRAGDNCYSSKSSRGIIMQNWELRWVKRPNPCVLLWITSLLTRHDKRATSSSTLHLSSGVVHIQKELAIVYLILIEPFPFTTELP